MPRYFFDVMDGDLIVDSEGVDLPDVRAAHDKAIKALPDITKSYLSDKQKQEVSVTMRDESGRPMFRATLTIRAEWLASLAFRPQG
ncbi:hypothetical protein MBRA_05070 [Methylobacterium brachiatum]|nr:hypothetical protein MBRA_05070 [Methylobacterium brachiatum]